MKTITPWELQRLIDQGEQIELIDVRPKRDFERVHALTARSIPLSNFEPHSVLAHRKLDRHAPLYLMCRRKTLASLAACGLSGAGLDEPIVVEGGLEAWEAQGLPVASKKSWRVPKVSTPKVLLVAAIVAALTLVFHGFLFLLAVSLFAIWAVFHAVRFALHYDRVAGVHLWHNGTPVTGGR